MNSASRAGINGSIISTTGWYSVSGQAMETAVALIYYPLSGQYLTRPTTERRGSWGSGLIMNIKLYGALAASAMMLFAGSALAADPWPSVAEQLAADGVRPGSALEQLIRANQNFDLLRADELTTTRAELPPWLKVIWKKEHPKGNYTAADPTGGYPLVLREVHEWMLSHQDLKSGVAEADQFPAGNPDPDAPIVSGEVRVSGLQTSPRSESDIRVNYWNAQKIISASNNISGAGVQAQFYSGDGGVTWGQTTLSLASGDSFQSDPTVEWTSDGTAWSSTLGINSGGSVLKLRTYKSTDSGVTWALEATPSAAQTSVDKQMHWVDHSATSACKDFQYIIYHNGAPAFITTRNATTNIWGAPIQVSGAESTGTAIGSDIAANSAGDAFGFWPTTTNRKVFVTKSTNCGVGWATPVQIATTFDGFDIGIPSMNSRRALVYVSGGTFRSASKNMVYAAWTDLSGETGCTAAGNEPGSNVASVCKTRIWFSRSSDGGATWSAKVMLNNQASKNDQFNQDLVVDETTGAVGVIYYDTVADAGRLKTHIYYQSSFDDGATWLPATQVTTLQTDETSAGADNGNQYGDYNSLSGIAGTFFPSWTDRRAGLKEEIWTAKIVDQACTAPGVPTIGGASAVGSNQVQVTWANGAPASTTFNVYRADGTCASPGSFGSIATGLAGSPYLDNAVSGGSTYAYKVSGVDATGSCESAQSACVEATATGQCTLSAIFGGLQTADNAATGTCTNNLGWAAATAQCAGPISYNVYRDISSGFTPSMANLIASGVSGTTYVDFDQLNSGVQYFYVVRAIDASNGSNDGNTMQKSATPTGPVATGNLVETFENASGFDNPGWTHAALNGAVDWVWSTAQSQTPTHSWFSAEQTSVSNRVLTTPVLSALANTTLSFFHTYAFEGTVAQCYDAGTLEISTNAGSTWSVVPDAAFTAGGFTGTVNASFSNPLAGKRAWCAGTVGAMTQVNVNLGAYAGQAFQLRWHQGDDSSAGATGWYVDSVTINNAGTASMCTTGTNDFIFVDGFDPPPM
jgi:hypothetical protein